MVSTNRFQGLHRGPIDHNASSVINAVSDNAIDMGSAVLLTTSIEASEMLPRVEQGISQGSKRGYGVAVGGDADGIYGDGTISVDDSTKATTGAGQGVVIVTQGRCPARVSGSTSGGAAAVAIGDGLTISGVAGELQKAILADVVIAIALNDVESGDLDMIAVDVQREGIF